MKGFLLAQYYVCLNFDVYSDRKNGLFPQLGLSGQKVH